MDTGLVVYRANRIPCNSYTEHLRPVCLSIGEGKFTQANFENYFISMTPKIEIFQQLAWHLMHLIPQSNCCTACNSCHLMQIMAPKTNHYLHCSSFLKQLLHSVQINLLNAIHCTESNSVYSMQIIALSATHCFQSNLFAIHSTHSIVTIALSATN